jgi:DNA-directed RNA polymerase specialized sigma24 family protein
MTDLQKSEMLLLRLERAMASMDRCSREIFLAHRLDNLTYEEIAARTGLPLARVEQHIAEATLHIGRELTAMERRQATS